MREIKEDCPAFTQCSAQQHSKHSESSPCVSMPDVKESLKTTSVHSLGEAQGEPSTRNSYRDVLIMSNAGTVDVLYG